MERKELTNILYAWQNGLITEQEKRLSLFFAIQGRRNALSAGINRVVELKEMGVLG